MRTKEKQKRETPPAGGSPARGYGREAQLARDEMIYNERARMLEEPGAMPTRVDTLLAVKYGYSGPNAIFYLRKRVEARRAAAAAARENKTAEG